MLFRSHMKARLDELPKRFDIVGDVRGLGLMVGIEMVRDQTTKERAPDLRDRLEAMCFERGLLVRQTGDIIALAPPLIVERAQIDQMFSTLGEVLRGH